MLFVSLLVVLFIPSSLSTERHDHHILVIAPPLFSHIIASLELAKQLSAHCHVTYLISASRVKELEQKGFIPTSNGSQTLDVVGLIDGNDESLIEFQLEDSQIGLKNSSQVCDRKCSLTEYWVIIDDDQKLIFSAAMNRMGTALHQLLNTNSSTYPSTSIGRLTINNSLTTTRPISQPIDMIIVRSFAPMPYLNLSIPVHVFLPSNLRAVINYLQAAPPSATGAKDPFDYIRENVRHATGFLCNSLSEFDEQYVEEFRKLFGNLAPIRFIGPLIFTNERNKENQTNEIIDWLDKQPDASVIYIAFGSVVRLPASAIDLVARALSTHSFIWSLKSQTTLPASLTNLDPRRQLVLKWTPQRAILAHPAVAFFFSHGGWNSLLEGMLHGQALLVWPFFGDQFDNALRMVELGMANRISDDLQGDIAQMFANQSLSSKAKEIQQRALYARETSAKERILEIAQLVSSNSNVHGEL